MLNRPFGCPIVNICCLPRLSNGDAQNPKFSLQSRRFEFGFFLSIKFYSTSCKVRASRLIRLIESIGSRKTYALRHSPLCSHNVWPRCRMNYPKSPSQDHRNTPAASVLCSISGIGGELHKILSSSRPIPWFWRKRIQLRRFGKLR